MSKSKSVNIKLLINAFIKKGVRCVKDEKDQSKLWVCIEIGKRIPINYEGSGLYSFKDCAGNICMASLDVTVNNVMEIYPIKRIGKKYKDSRRTNYKRKEEK